MWKLVCVPALVGCGRLGFDTTDVDASTFCDTVTPLPTLCADFDRGLPLESGFTVTSTSNGGVLASTTNARSMPGALEASSENPLAPATFSKAALVYLSPASVSTVALAYEFLITARPPNGHMEHNDVVIRVPGVGTFYSDLDLSSAGADRYLEEFNISGGAFLTNDTPIPTMSAGEWHHVEIAVDLTQRTRSLTIDGVTLVQGPAVYPTEPGSLQLDVGIAYGIGSPTGHRIDIDNVVLRTQ